MTKCIVIGEQPTESKKKPIEFVKYIGRNGENEAPNFEPIEFKVIELIRKSGTEEYDILFAYDDMRSNGSLYLGHWNDGVAE